VTESESNTSIEFEAMEGQLPGFPGHILRQVREQKGLSQQEVARELHLTSRVINGLEVDDFSHVNSPIFARGYIRSYARHLGLDADELVAEYDAVYGSPDHGKKPMSTIRKVSEQARPGDAWVKLVSVVLVLALVGASWWWWQSQSDTVAPVPVDEVTVQDSQGEDRLAKLPEDEGLDLELQQMGSADATVGFTDEAVVEEPVAQEPAVNPEPAEEPQSVAEQAPVIEQESITEQQAVVVAPAAEQASVPTLLPEVAPGEGLLVIEFADDCWVEIQNGAGTMVVADLKSKGDVIALAVATPAQVLLGRASAVTKFEFAARNIDLEPHTRKDIARLNLEL
jgi:cytoskeleton protein RodZ